MRDPGTVPICISARAIPLTSWRVSQEQVAAAVKATQGSADAASTSRPAAEGLNRAPAVEHVPEGKAPVIELSPSPSSTGNIQGANEHSGLWTDSCKSWAMTVQSGQIHVFAQ